MNNPIKLILVLFCFGLIISCQLDRDKKVERQKFQFKVGADANLFFRNVRQIYYDRESPDGKWQAYRLTDRTITGTFISPVIVINWLKDEAYLLIESSDDLAEEDFFSLIIEDEASLKKDTLILKDRGRERMLEFGSRIYEAIQKKQSIKILKGENYIPLFPSDTTRDSFRLVMADFYRLTGVF